MTIQKMTISQPTQMTMPDGTKQIIDAGVTSRVDLFLMRNERNQPVLVQSCPSGESGNRSSRTEYRAAAPFQLSADDLSIHMEEDNE